MKDRFGRDIDYIRISVTDRCNLRCRYCMPEDGVEWVEHNEILTYEEIIAICKIVAELGIKKVRITGGEPLVRKGIDGLIKEIKKIKGIEQIAMTTNGILLKGKCKKLKEAGLDSVNISLDTLNSNTYEKITKKAMLSQVLEAIDEAEKCFGYVKINCVPIKIFNFDEITQIAALAKYRNIDVRFIEIMPLGLGKDFEYIPNTEILSILEGAYNTPVETAHKNGNGPAKYYKFDEFKGSVGLISAISKGFCKDCNRIRLTSVGDLKLCLHNNIGVDIKSHLRNGKSLDEIKNIIVKTVYDKPFEHSFYGDFNSNSESRNMFQIGG